MQIGQPSRTALATAYARAFHQVTNDPRIFTDPLAVPITGLRPDELGERDTAMMRRRDADPELNRKRRLFLAARHRFAEDTVAEGVADGVIQAVILGAGLDTFGYRNPFPGLRVFEVDHPDTQAWKRRQVTDAGIDAPPSLTYAPVDFETQTLAEGLAAAGFRRELPAVFVWLGVTMYLSREAIDATLRFIAGQAGPSRIVLDYLYPPAGTADSGRQARTDRVAAIGEPWLSFFTAEQLADTLHGLGFQDIDDRAAATLVAGYLGVPRPPTATAAAHVARASRCAH
jgi:methyltransferase (TIGR00027 family)